MGFIMIPGISKIYAENCGLAILNPGWTHRKRNLDTSVFILGHQGNVSIREGDEVLKIHPSSFCFLSEGRTHWGSEKLQDKARYYWIHFKSTAPPQDIPDKEALIILNNKEIAKTRLNDSLLLPKQMTLENTHIIRDGFHELLYEQQKKTFTNQKYQALVKLLLIQLNEMILDFYSGGGEQDGNRSLVHKIIQLVYENLTDCNFSVKKLADIMCYNPDYLNRHFKTIMEQSLIEYIIDRRIEHSLRDLIDSDKTLAEIAGQSGFSSYRNYIRQFKLRNNVIPSEWRNRHRMMHITNK